MKLIPKFRNLNPNDAIIVKNILIAAIMKGGGLAVSFLSAPAFVKYFGSEKQVLGVWFTLLSMLIWFLNFDLGIGNGIRNHLVKAFANNDRLEIKRILSSGLFSIGLVTLFLTMIGVGGICCFNLNWLFNISTGIISESTLFFTAIVVFISLMLSFLLTIVNSIFYAMQRSGVNSVLGLAFSSLLLIYVLVFRFDNTDIALRAVAVAYMIFTIFPRLVAAIIVFRKELRDCLPSIKYVDKQTIDKVLKIGSLFFICQIAYMVITNTNEFLVSRYFGPQYAAEYGFYYRLTSLVSMIVTLGLTPIWSIVTKALTENDIVWLNRLYRRIKNAGLFVILLQFVLIPFLQFLMDIWLGRGFIVVDYYKAIAFASFSAVFVYSGMLSTVVCGMAKMKLQVYCYSLGVIVKLVFIDVFAGQYFDWSIVVWSNVLVLAPYCVLQQISLNRFFKKNRA